MTIWILEYFNIGSGTHMVDCWHGKPSEDQLRKAEPYLRDEDVLELLVDGCSESDHNLYEKVLEEGVTL
jgi:hypothetical protein